MKTLALEVRDVGTFIPVMAVQCLPDNEGQRYLLHRCGYSFDQPAMILTRLNGDGAAYSDPYSWGNRTMKGAHLYILEHFAELVDGDVVDVQFHVLHETDRLRVSERFIVPATESIANTANKPERLARRFRRE